MNTATAKQVTVTIVSGTLTLNAEDTAEPLLAIDLDSDVLDDEDAFDRVIHPALLTAGWVLGGCSSEDSPASDTYVGVWDVDRSPR